MTDCCPTPPPAGTLIESNLYQIAAVSSQDPRNAAARSIRGFLENLTFCLDGLGKVADIPFKLDEVIMEWPDHHEKTNYPSASIVEVPGALEGHNFVPTAIEETFEEFGENTVLWKTAELVSDFQVDFWTNDNPTREAIAALLPAVFAPFEDKSGIRVFSGPEYFSRPVRLLMTEQIRVDDSESAFSRIKRLRTTVTATIEVVHLRRVATITPSTSLEAGETVEVLES